MQRLRVRSSVGQLCALACWLGAGCASDPQQEVQFGTGAPGPAPATDSTGAAGAAAQPDLGPASQAPQPVIGSTGDPSSPRRCEPGTYTGSFECQIHSPDGSVSLSEGFMLTGPITLTLAESTQQGEFSLVVSGGALEASANLFLGIRANIEGSLDCDTLELKARAVDGAWAVGDPDAPLIPGGALEFELLGALDPATDTIGGQWTLDDPALTETVGTCDGPWSITLDG